MTCIYDWSWESYLWTRLQLDGMTSLLCIFDEASWRQKFDTPPPPAPPQLQGEIATDTLKTPSPAPVVCINLDGRHRARVIAESLARVIAAIRITSGTDMIGRTGVPDNGNDWRKFRIVPRSEKGGNF